MRYFFVFFLALFSYGCVSQVATPGQHVKAYIGKPIAEAQKLYVVPRRGIAESRWKDRVYAWEEKIFDSDDGKKIYLYSNPYRDCEISSVVDSNGIIVSGSHKGNEC